MGNMKRIIGLAFAAVLILCVTAGGVWAYVHDDEYSSSNQIIAGTLDMVPTTSGNGVLGKYTVTAGGNEVNGNVVFTKMRPGETGSITWTLNNTGNLGGILTIASTVTFSDVSQNEIEGLVPGNNNGGNGDLDEYVGVKLTRNGTYILGDASNYVPFAGLEAVLDAENQTLAASSQIVYSLSWAIAADIKGAGLDGKFGTGDDVDVNENIIQSDTAQIGITFTVNQ